MAIDGERTIMRGLTREREANVQVMERRALGSDSGYRRMYD